MSGMIWYDFLFLFFWTKIHTFPFMSGFW
jgi:hypothetical protein